MFCFRNNKIPRSLIGSVGVFLFASVLCNAAPLAMASRQGQEAGSALDSRTYNEPNIINQHKKTFDRLDTNSDGCLTSADFEPGRSKLTLLAAIPYYQDMIWAMVSESRKKWHAYAGLDSNGDGRVEFKEFIVPLPIQLQRTQPE